MAIQPSSSETNLATFNIFKKNSTEKIPTIQKDAFDTDYLDQALKNMSIAKLKQETPLKKLVKIAKESEYFKRTNSTDPGEGTTNVLSSDSSC